MAQNKEGYSVDRATREWLDDIWSKRDAKWEKDLDKRDAAFEKTTDKQSKDIKEYMTLLIAPIIKEQAEVKTILVGTSKINGLVGGVRTLSTQVKLIYVVLVVGLVTKGVSMFFVG